MSDRRLQTTLQDFTVYRAIQSQVDHAKALYRKLTELLGLNTELREADGTGTAEYRLTPEQVSMLHNLGMLPLADLRDGAHYVGYCRNATDAVWHAETQTFRYRRHKFGIASEEDVLHPETPQEDGGGDEVFVPTSEIVGAE